MQDITLNGASYQDVPGVILPKTGGGTALFVDNSDVDAIASDIKNGKKIRAADGSSITGNYIWSWMAPSAELWQEDFYHTSYALSSTSFPTWEPSKTAKSIKATSSIGTFSADMVNYEYLIRWRNEFDAAYIEGATLQNQVYREVSDLWQVVMRRPNTNASVGDDNFYYNVCMTFYNTPLMMYYSSAGALTPYFSVAYGIYAGATATGISSTTSNTPTITVKTPTCNARCHDTYFGLNRAPELDQSDSIFKSRCDIYRLPVGSVMRCLYENVVYLYNHPITYNNP